MGTLYSGVAASLATGVQITVPADLDPDNGATFAVGMQKIADYLEALRTKPTDTTVAGYSFLMFGATTCPANTTPTNLVPGGPFAAAGAAQALPIVLPVSGVLRSWTVNIGTASVGGTEVFNVLVNGTAGVSSVTFPAGTGGFGQGSGPGSYGANATITVTVTGGVGISAGAQNVTVILAFSRT